MQHTVWYDLIFFITINSKMLQSKGKICKSMAKQNNKIKSLVNVKTKCLPVKL